MNKVLVVDDDQAVCNMLEKFLTQKGYDVINASSGEEAIAKIKEENPRIVLLDIRMPGISGVETLKEIRKRDQNIKVIVLTAVAEEKTARECLDSGANDYITKPMDLGRIESALKIWLE